MEQNQGVGRALVCPPRLNFLGQNDNNWNLNILVVTQSGLPQQAKADVEVAGISVNNQAQLLDTYKDVAGQINFFWSYPVSIKQNNQEQMIPYYVDGKSYSFKVPAINQNNHFAMYSCNGYQTIEDKETVGGISPMWDKLRALHEEKPLHLLIGGGDQIYADGVVHKTKKDEPVNNKNAPMGLFALPSLKNWLNDGNPNYDAPFTEEIKTEVAEFYFTQYREQYNIPALAKMQAQVPQLVTGDDHDFFDGIGSYSPEMESSAVFKGIFAIAWRFYLLYQQHASSNNPPEHGFGDKGYSYLRQFNNGKLAVLALDTRRERTKKQVISKNTWQMALERMHSLPDHCRHLLVILAVPVVYPSLNFLLKIYDAADISVLMSKLGDSIPGLKNQFGKWELRDDIGDHWNAKDHVEECHWMIETLQNYSQRTNTRVTFVSGDVHLAGLGKVEHVSKPDLYQIFTSPMGNITAPSSLARGLEYFENEDIANGSVAGLVKWDDSEEKLVTERNFATGCLTPRQRNLFLTLYPERSKPLHKKINQTNETAEVEEPSSCCKMQ